MNKLCRTLSFTLLLSILCTQSMENNIAISSPSEQFTIQKVAIHDDTLKEFFKYVCSNQAMATDQSKQIGNLRSVCKYWYHLLNPKTIRELLNWTTDNILHEFKHVNVRENSQQYYTKFLAYVLNDDTPQVYKKINIKLLVYRNAYDTIELLLKNGADPNFYYPPQYTNDKGSLLYFAMQCSDLKIFKLALRFGGDIYQNDENDCSVFPTALTQVKMSILFPLFVTIISYPIFKIHTRLTMKRHHILVDEPPCIKWVIPLLIATIFTPLCYIKENPQLLIAILKEKCLLIFSSRKNNQ